MTGIPYAVRTVMVQQSKILLIHHTFKDPAMFGKWTFPGGRLDPHETDPVAALHREMSDELSVDIKVLGQVGLFFSRAGADYAVFAARPLGPLGPLQTDEIREVAWLTPAQIYHWHRRDKLQFGFEMDAVSTYLKKFG